MSKQLWNRKETKVFLINCILNARDDITESNRSYIRNEYNLMDIEEVVIEYEFYLGEFIFEIPSK